jgi:hypothetical protein
MEPLHTEVDLALETHVVFGMIVGLAVVAFIVGALWPRFVGKRTHKTAREGVVPKIKSTTESTVVVVTLRPGH